MANLANQAKAKRVTLFEPPPLDASKAPIENVLELTPVLDIGPVSTVTD